MTYQGNPVGSDRTSLRFSPSRLSRLVLCPAFRAAPFPVGIEGDRLRGKHALAMLSVIRRHLKQGYGLLAAEEYENDEAA
jgi:hypothetical protein